VILPTVVTSPGLIFSTARATVGKYTRGVVQSIGQGHENNNCDFATRQLLLVAEVCIDCEHQKQLPRESGVRRSVFQTSLLPGLCETRGATIDEIFFKRFRGTLVDQNSHFSRATRFRRASSSKFTGDTAILFEELIHSATSL
jgi:hypothetical protein